MNEIELARQQLLEHRVDYLTVFIPSALAVLVAAIVAIVGAAVAIRGKDECRFHKAASFVVCSLIPAIPFVLFAILSINEVIDTYIAPNTIVPGYVPEK